MSLESKDEKTDEKAKGKRHRVNGFEEWGGYMASKKMKLAAQFAGQRDFEIADQSETGSDLFKGISIFVNGYTKPSADELKRLMLIHEGTYHHYYSSKTTYTIASNLPYSKIKKLKNQIVLKPDWVTDCIKAGKLLPYQHYLLCPPEMLHNQPRLKFENCLATNYPGEESSNVEKCYNETNVSISPDASWEENLFPDEPSEMLSKSHSFPNKITKSTTVSVQPKSTDITSPSKNEGPVTAGHPAFLSEFYSHSRLHHISTAGQELKRYVQSLVNSNGSKTFPGRDNIKNLVKNGSLSNSERDAFVIANSERSQRVVMHLDMDCFFVSVGLRNHPELKGEPVAVTHSKGKRGGAQEGSDLHYEAAHYSNHSKKKVEGLTSVEHDLSDEGELKEEELVGNKKISKYSKDYGSLSEIASCSYEARKVGLRNGMFLGEALRRCPNLKTIPYDFTGYSEVSKELYDIVASYTLDIEAVSCDELFIDCAELLRHTGVSPLQFASVLRAEIEQTTKCTASAGLGANMLLARLANRAAKPNGQYYVSNDQIEEFMLKQKVKDLPGVGYSTTVKFERMDVITCEDLQKWSLSKLQQEFGPKTGETLFKRCRGKDNRTVQLQRERKSVSAEINYGIRFEKEEEVFEFLKELSVEVVNRLRNVNCKGKSITLKLMVRRRDAPVQTAKFMGHGVCDHFVKSVSLRSATDNPVVIGNECCSLAKSLKIKPEDFRGIGIQLSKLELVHKDTKGSNSIESFVCTSVRSSEQENHTSKEIFAPKKLELVNKPLPKGGSVKDFLSDKASPSKIPPSKASPRKQQVYQPQTLSVDQLDQSVLNALPEDLQKEVLELYSKKTSNKPATSFRHSNVSSHPSTSKSNKLSTKKSGSINQIKTKIPSKKNTLLDCMVSTKSNSSNDMEEGTILKKTASIGGAENINEVRSLVKEWVLSSQVVLEEDVDQFRDFLLQVIDEDLKKVDLILKYFHRIVSTANTLWQQAYLTILSYVQQKMLQNYGTMLEAKSDFST